MPLLRTEVDVRIADDRKAIDVYGTGTIALPRGVRHTSGPFDTITFDPSLRAEIRPSLMPLAPAPDPDP